MANSRFKQISLIILCQTACVAVGLWMEHQFATSSVHRIAMEQARTEVETLAERGRENLAELSFDAIAADVQLQSQIRNQLESDAPNDGGSLIVDRNWRVVLAAQDSPNVQTVHPTVGEQIDWMPFDDSSKPNTKVLQGSFNIANGEHLAAARMLTSGVGYVVVYRPVANVLLSSTMLIRSLPWLSGVTLLWTSALLASVITLLLTRFYDGVDRERKQAASEMLLRTQNLVRTRDAVIFGLAKLADSRDPETGEHLERISIYSTTFAATLRRHPNYSNIVSSSFVRLIGISSALHDIGKVGIQDSILRKPAELTPSEHESMQSHTTIGADCIKEIEQRLGSSNFLHMAHEIAMAHHERWDGKGYPNGLSGESIPLAARIVAIADVYDALSSKRVYKPEFPHDECVALIRDEAGKQFDPNLVEVWLSIEPKFRDIALQYAGAPLDERFREVPPDSGKIQPLRKEALAATSSSAK